MLKLTIYIRWKLQIIFISRLKFCKEKKEIHTKTLKTSPECEVEFPSPVENIEKSASKISCRN